MFQGYPGLKENDLNWYYREEKGVEVTTYGANRPKYSEVLNFFSHHTIDKRNYADIKDVKVTVEKETPFHLLEQEFGDLYDKAYKAFETEGRRITKENRSLIRINRISHGEKQTELFIQPTDYNTQFVTNLVMDMKHANGKTWRQKMQEKYGSKFPLLNAAPLANNLGVSLILVTENGQTILPLRPSLAIWGNMWGCTSSFATAWKEKFDRISFKEFLDLIVPDHLWLELRIKENIKFTPLALCREWLRGGKPQLLLVGRTDLTLDQIRSNIEKAEHRDEIMKRWTRRILMTEKNADEYMLSQELMINTEYLRRYVQTPQGKDFLGKVIQLSGI